MKTVTDALVGEEEDLHLILMWMGSQCRDCRIGVTSSRTLMKIRAALFLTNRIFWQLRLWEIGVKCDT